MEQILFLSRVSYGTIESLSTERMISTIWGKNRRREHS
jgi:hypothetical protein